MRQRQWQLSHCDHRLQYHCRFHLQQTLCATGRLGGCRFCVCASSVTVLHFCGCVCGTPSYLRLSSLDAVWKPAGPGDNLSLLCVVFVFVFSAIKDCAAVPPSLTFPALWTQLKEHSADSGTNLSHRVTLLYGCRHKPLQVDKYLSTAIWFVQYRRG